jgi:hypothetical protein
MNVAEQPPDYMRRIGFWSASLTTGAAVIFGASVVYLLISSPAATWQGIDAYVAGYDPVPVFVTNLSSLAVAPTFVLMVGALVAFSPARHRALAQVALTFAGAHLVVIALNYVLQTTVIHAAIERGEAAGLGVAVMGNPASVFWMGEMLGYSLMIIAGLCLVPLFVAGRSGAVIRWIFIVNGVATGVAAVTYFVTVDAMNPLVAGSLGVWCVSWPVATALIAFRFRQPTMTAEAAPAPLSA